MEEKEEFAEEKYRLTEREIAAGVTAGIIKALAIFFLIVGVISAICELGMHIATPYEIPATHSIILGAVLFVASFIF